MRKILKLRADINPKNNQITTPWPKKKMGLKAPPGKEVAFIKLKIEKIVWKTKEDGNRC